MGITSGTHKRVANNETNTDGNKRIIEHQELAARYVRYFVRRWRCYISPDEVVSLANLALCRASQSYIEERKAQFQTYLYLVVQDTIRQYMNKECRYARTTSFVFSAKEERKEFSSETHFAALEGESNAITPQSMLEGKQRYSVLFSLVRQLAPDECQVIEHLYFAEGEVKDLPHVLGCSERQIWRKRSLALRNLRNTIERRCMDL